MIIFFKALLCVLLGAVTFIIASFTMIIINSFFVLAITATMLKTALFEGEAKIHIRVFSMILTVLFWPIGAIFYTLFNILAAVATITIGAYTQGIRPALKTCNSEFKSYMEYLNEIAYWDYLLGRAEPANFKLLQNTN